MYLTGALGVNMAEYVLSGKDFHPGPKRYVSILVGHIHKQYIQPVVYPEVLCIYACVLLPLWPCLYMQACVCVCVCACAYKSTHTCISKPCWNAIMFVYLFVVVLLFFSFHCVVFRSYLYKPCIDNQIFYISISGQNVPGKIMIYMSLLKISFTTDA